MGIAQGRERRKLRPQAEGVTGDPRGGEYLLDGPSGVLVPLFDSPCCPRKQKSYCFSLLFLCR